jgi:hypothetical protein
MALRIILTANVQVQAAVAETSTVSPRAGYVPPLIPISEFSTLTRQLRRDAVAVELILRDGREDRILQQIDRRRTGSCKTGYSYFVRDGMKCAQHSDRIRCE